MKIILNGETFELERPLTIKELLTRLKVDSRRVAVEHNLMILKRQTYESTILSEGDHVELVNFVGGGTNRS